MLKKMVTKNNKHIHTWNDYNKEGKLCCSNCGLIYNKYLQDDTFER